MESSFNKRFRSLFEQVYIKILGWFPVVRQGRLFLRVSCRQGWAGKLFRSVNEEASYGLASKEASQKNVSAQVSQAAQGEPP